MNLFLESIRRHTPAVMEELRSSSVLLAFLIKEGEWQLLLEQRSASLHHQPNEICLPGGMAEPGELPSQAALREACEELQLSPNQLQLLGAGDVLPTPGGLVIHPFFGFLTGYTGSFSADEVDHVFTVPVRWFLQHPPEKHAAHTETCPDADFPFDRIPRGKDYPWRRGSWPVLFYQYKNYCIWGITAKIIYHSLILIQDLGGLPDPSTFSATHIKEHSK